MPNEPAPPGTPTASPTTVSEIFDPAAWSVVDGFDFTDITYHRAVERDADDRRIDGAVVGDVGEVEPVDHVPRVGVEDLGHRPGR